MLADILSSYNALEFEHPNIPTWSWWFGESIFFPSQQVGNCWLYLVVFPCKICQRVLAALAQRINTRWLAIIPETLVIQCVHPREDDLLTCWARLLREINSLTTVSYDVQLCVAMCMIYFRFPSSLILHTDVSELAKVTRLLAIVVVHISNQHTEAWFKSCDLRFLRSVEESIRHVVDHHSALCRIYTLLGALWNALKCSVLCFEEEDSSPVVRAVIRLIFTRLWVSNST